VPLGAYITVDSPDHCGFCISCV